MKLFELLLLVEVDAKLVFRADVPQLPGRFAGAQDTVQQLRTQPVVLEDLGKTVSRLDLVLDPGPVFALDAAIVCASTRI